MVTKKGSSRLPQARALDFYRPFIAPWVQDPRSSPNLIGFCFLTLSRSPAQKRQRGSTPYVLRRTLIQTLTFRQLGRWCGQFNQWGAVAMSKGNAPFLILSVVGVVSVLFPVAPLERVVALCPPPSCVSAASD